MLGLMGVEGEPQQFFDHFDASQGGNTSGGDGFALEPEVPGKGRRELTPEEMEEIRRLTREGMNSFLMSHAEELKARTDLSKSLSDEERVAFAKDGSALVERLEGIGSEKLSRAGLSVEDEAYWHALYQASYYRYSVAVTLLGMSREEFLPTNPVAREGEMLFMEAGAKVAALDYLRNFSDDPVATWVGVLGMEAPDDVHRLFNLQGLGSNIQQFVRKYD